MFGIGTTEGPNSPLHNADHAVSGQVVIIKTKQKNPSYPQHTEVVDGYTSTDD